MNIQCLSNKVDMLELLLDEYSPGIVSVSEHWLSSEQLDLIHINGYKMVSAFCRSNYAHGGTVIFVSDELLPSCSHIPELSELSVEMVFECSAIVFGKDLCILAVYRSPEGAIGQFLDALSDVLRRCTRFKHIVLVGDFNVNGLETKNINVKLLHDITESSGLLSLIDVPTRIFTRCDGKHSETLIDYIFTSENVNSAVKVIHNGISDHSFQLLTMRLLCPRVLNDKPNPVYNRCFSQPSMESFRYLLSDIITNLWCNCPDDVNEFFNMFWCEFEYLFSCCFPLRRRYMTNGRRDASGGWITDDLRRRSVELRDLNWLRHVTGSETLSGTYKLLKKEHMLLTKNMKTSQNVRMIENSTNKVKCLWNIVNTNLNKSKEQKQISLKINDEVISKPAVVANALANHFSSIVQVSLAQHFGNYRPDQLTLSRSIGHSMFFDPVVPEEVEAVIRSLPTGKATGPDEVPVKLIKYCAQEIAPVISHLTNISVAQGRFPLAMKTSAVVPIYKKNDPMNINNYRPISLTSIFSKIVEKMVCSRLTKFLDRFNIISERQHGFRSNHSTETAAAELVQYVHGKWEDKLLVAGVFFDLSRAFDTLDHSILIRKLEKYGIRGTIAQWISSYLSGRESYVRVMGERSGAFSTDLGTPQGSTIGPLMFLLYVNDLPDGIPNGKVQLYADDTVIIVDAPDHENLLKKVDAVYKDFKNWCRENYLILNESKTSVVHFCDVRSRVQIQNISIPVSSNMEFLGMVIDQHMDWKEHVEKVCSKLKRNCFALIQLKKCLNRESLVNAYYAMIYSIISYGIVVWGQSVEVSRVFVLQKKIIRHIFDLEYRTSCRNTFIQEKILTVTGIYLLKVLTNIFKNKDQLTTNSDVHMHYTRQCDQLRIDRHRLAKTERSPIMAGSYLYNKLPQQIKSIKTFNRFKKELKEFLTDNCFYTIAEYIQICS